jgi:hypothetical protein
MLNYHQHPSFSLYNNIRDESNLFFSREDNLSKLDTLKSGISL